MGITEDMDMDMDMDMNVFVREGAVVIEPAVSRWDRLVGASARKPPIGG